MGRGRVEESQGLNDIGKDRVRMAEGGHGGGVGKLVMVVMVVGRAIGSGFEEKRNPCCL